MEPAHFGTAGFWPVTKNSRPKRLIGFVRKEMRRPRVIFVNRVYWPSLAATAQLLTDLSGGLAARGWEVHVIAAGDGSTSHEGVTIHRTGEGDEHGGLVSRTRNYWRFLRQLRAQLRNLLQP